MAKQDLFRSKFKNHYLIINLTLSLDRKSLEQMTLPVYTVRASLLIKPCIQYILVVSFARDFSDLTIEST